MGKDLSRGKEALYLAIITSLLIHIGVLSFLNFYNLHEPIQPEEMVLDMDMIELEEAIPVPEQPGEDGLTSDVRNLIANQASERTWEETHYSKRTYDKMEDDVETKVKSLEQQMKDEIRKEREAKEADEKTDPDANNKAKEATKEQRDDYGWFGKDKSYSKATVEYDLAGREGRSLPAPAYRCKGQGVVVVAIEVNPDGQVVSAEIISSTASTECLEEEALRYANRSTFNKSASAERKQKGKLTYRFIAQ